MKQLTLIMLGLFVINFPSLLAQQATTFTAYDGLINNKVFFIFEDMNDDLWFGTAGGLGKWILERDMWVDYTQENSPLVNNKVNTILQDDNGHLWIGTNDGLNEFDGENWNSYTHVKMPNSLRADHITSLYVDSKNNLWIGTKGGGVTKRYRDTDDLWKWQPYDKSNSDIISDEITSINEDSSGNIWFGTLDSGIAKFDSVSNWTSYPELAEIGTKINVIFKDHDEQLWFGTANGVFGTYDGNHWISCELNQAVRSIAEDRDGNLWFGTESDGVYKYDRISCVKPQIEGLKSVPTIWSIIRDHNGYLWLGTNGAGIIRLHLNWQMFNKENTNMVANNTTSIDEDEHGNLWLGTKMNGIVKYDGDLFYPYDVNGSTYGTNRVNSIMVDRDNWIWCATEKGVFKFDGDSVWIPYDSLANQVVHTAFQDHNKVFWFGTRSGVRRFDGEDWTTIDTVDGLPAKIVTTIFEDHLNYLWFGTSKGGVGKFDGDSIVAVYDTSDGLLDNQITAIIQDDDFAYWFGTGKGLIKFDGTNWIDFTRGNSQLPDNHVTCMRMDEIENIWIGTYGGGLCKFDEQMWVNFSIKQIGSNVINDIFQDSEGNFWIATEAGLVKYIPDKIPPKTIITHKPSSIIGDTYAFFLFKGIDIESPKEKLVYSWALKDDLAGDVPYWSCYTKDNHCVIHPPGNGTYTFLVKAKDEFGNEDPTPASFQFTVDIVLPTTMIQYPDNDKVISGKVPIIGSACDTSLTNEFKKYWLEYAEVALDGSISESDWNIIADTLKIPVIMDTLIYWDTNSLYGSYRLRLSAEDLSGRINDHTIDVQIVETLREVPKDIGALLKCSHSQAQLYIPPWALEKDMKIHFSPKDTSKIWLPSNKQVKYSNMAYDVGPGTTQLQKPATLTLHYSDSDITSLDENKLALSLVQYDELQLFGGFINSEKHQISTSINKFGTYILVEHDTTKFGPQTIRDINCQPRMFSPKGTGFSETTNISFNLAVDSEASVKIYNLAGRLVCTLLKNRPMRAGNNSSKWDGRNYNGNICPSDLYIIAIDSGKQIKTKTVVILDKSHD